MTMGEFDLLLRGKRKLMRGSNGPSSQYQPVSMSDWIAKVRDGGQG